MKLDKRIKNILLEERVDFKKFEDIDGKIYIPDSDSPSKVYCIKNWKCKSIILEISETKLKDKSIYDLGVYGFNGKIPVRKVLGIFNEKDSKNNQNDAEALLDRFMDAEDFYAELVDYQREILRKCHGGGEN